MLNKERVRFTVIIPVHNREDYIADTLDSILNQDFDSYEIICVDDCSTDNTVNIIKEFQKKDPRIVLIELDKTSSAFIARKRGIEKAAGEYILFLDSDDSFAENGLSVVDEALKKDTVDILHFNAEVINCGTSPERVEMNQKIIEPYFGELKDEDVFFGCFTEKLYKFTIWNKAFSADVCKKAMSMTDDGVYMKANDLMLFLPVAYCAKSYKGVDTPVVYKYCLGRGSTGMELLDYSSFARYCSLADTSKGLANFVEANSLDERYAEVVEALTDVLFKDCAANWLTKADVNISGKAFDLMCEKWGMESFLDRFGRSFGIAEIGELATRVQGSGVLKINKFDEVKTIGVYYLRLHNGGVQRVVSLLLPLYVRMGYRVVMFTDEHFPEEEYSIPDEVIRIIVPTCYEAGKIYYKERAKVFREAVEKYDIKLMLYHAASVSYLVYDFLFFKSLGLNFILTKHEYSTNAVMQLSQMFHRRFEVFRIIDVITVLSRADEVFLRLMGANAVYVPNIIEKIKPLEKLGNEVLWLGRLELSSKQYIDLIKIASVVKKTLPDIKFLVACAGDERPMEVIRENIEKFNVQENVKLEPFITDVERYYERARVHLVTSVTESFSMTIAESKSYGIPLVLYDLPHLELLKDGKGYVSVPQNDVFSAANAIIKIFTDDDYCCQLSAEAAESIIKFKEFEFEAVWGNIIKKVASGDTEFEKSQISEKEMSDLLKNTVSMYKIGSKANDAKISNLKKTSKQKEKKLKKKIKKQNEKIEKLENENRRLRKQRSPIIRLLSLIKRTVKKAFPKRKDEEQ